MAKCKRCKMEMCDLSTKTCKANKVVVFRDGTKFAPIPYTSDDPKIRCHDCNVATGGFHHLHCDMEICPRCGGQLLGCSCFVSKGEMSNTKKTRKIVLTPNHNYWRALGIRLNDMLIQSNGGCNGELRFTKQILKSLPGIDVEETLSLFQEIGGNCDCHVLHSIVGTNVMETAVRSGY